MYDFVHFDESTVVEDAIEEYEKTTGTLLYAGDERRMLINTFVYIAKIIAEKANYIGNQFFTQTADEKALTLDGEAKGVYRLKSEYALVTIRFSVQNIVGFDVIIPKGIRVTPNGGIFFATKREAIIQNGSTYIDAECEATIPGIIGNGYVEGTIKTIVDVVPYISTVTNIDISAGGSEIEELEDYRERILLKPYNYNTAGAEDAYIYLAKSADNTIGSVKVTSTTEDVTLTLLCKDGLIPTQPILNRVLESLDEKKKRPLADHVVVQAPTQIMYSIHVEYTIARENSLYTENIKIAVTNAIHSFVQNQLELGKAINPDTLRNYMLNAGAYTVTIRSPVFIAVSDASVGILDESIITYNGLS